MIYLEHNDFEIIDQIREGNHEALELMFQKYSPLISKKIYKFNLQYEYDDMFQEGLMILNKSIHKYNDQFKKSFTRYFEMNFERKLMTIISKKKRRNEIFSSNELYIYEHNHSTNTNSVYYELYKKEFEKVLTKEEYLVYTLRELQNFSITYIKQNLCIPEKKIYNTLYKAKAKIRQHFDN